MTQPAADTTKPAPPGETRGWLELARTGRYTAAEADELRAWLRDAEPADLVRVLSRVYAAARR